MTDNELNVKHKLRLFPEMEVVKAKKKPKCYKMTNAGYIIGGTACRDIINLLNNAICFLAVVVNKKEKISCDGLYAQNL